MRKLTAIVFSLTTAAAAAAAYVHVVQPEWLHGEFDESGEDDGGPPNPDDWIARNTYPTGQFDPTWAVEAGQQARAVVSAVPAGTKTYAKTRVPQSPLTLDASQFTALGPMPENNTQNTYGSVSGRINVIAIDQTDPTIAYAGSDGGGIWKTTNCCSTAAPPNPTSWEVVSDVPEVAGLSISDITIDPHNHNTIYAATGDLNYGSFSFGAVGVMKSSDQGQSWRLLGTDVFNPYYLGINDGFPQYQAIGKVVVDPNNSNTVIVGTKTSVYLSYDAGQNWVGPCYTNPYATGAARQRQDVTGLVPVSNGDGTTRLYVAIGTRGSATPVQPDLDQNGSNGVYRLDAIPGGGCPATNAWTLLNNGWLPSTGTGVPQLDFGRIELAVSPSVPSTMYAMLQSLQTSPSTKYQVLGVWRSDDAGNSWTQKAANNGTTSGTTNNILGCESSSFGGGGQMWYDARLTVQPDNPEITWLTGYDLYRSINGGSNYSDVTCGWGTKPTGTLDHVHVDQHALSFFPGNPDRMLIGTDGGVFYTENATSTAPLPSFRQLNDTINSIEFYFGDITSNFANSATPAVGAGAQDNGCSAVKFSGTPTGPVKWTSNCSGDGTMNKIEPISNAVWFNSSQYGSLARSLTYGNTMSGSFSTASGNTGGTWGGTSDLSASIFAMSYDMYKWGVLDAPGSGCSTASGCNHMLAGTNRLWETIDLTNPTASAMRSSWKARTPNLTKQSLILGADNRSYINYVTYSFSDPTVAAVGTNDGNVQLVFGLGTAATANCPATLPATDPNCANAVNVTDNNNVLPNRPIFGVRFDPLNALVAYAGVGGFNQNTPGRPGHVFQVTCSAYNCPSFTWKDKTGNLPNIPVEQIMPNPNFPQQVFAGTDWGLYYTDDITVDTPEWHYFESFPRVMVWELVVDRGYTTLAAFTRSRGAWAWPLPNAAIGSGADLGVTNTGSASVGAGAQASFVVTVTNNGPNTANNVVLSDPTPAGVTLASVAGDCAALPCRFATLANGVTRTITITYNVPGNFDTSQSIVNIASASSDTEDNVPANNSTTATSAVTSSADLALAMTGPATAATSGTVSYTITVTNNGPSVAQAVSVDDATPTGLNFVSNTGDCTNAFPCAFASLASGVSRTIVVTYQLPDTYAGSSIVNTASVSSATSDLVPANDSASVATAITRSADLALAMQAPAGAIRGGTLSYTIVLSNVGPGSAQTVSVADPTPTGLVFVSNSGDCATPFPCAFASLAPGATKVVIATFKVPADYAGPSPFVNTATVTSMTTDPLAGNDSASAGVGVSDSADLSIAQSGTLAVLAGSNVSYTVMVANAGPSSASAVSVSDVTPDGLSFGTISGDCTLLPCSLGTLAPGASRSFTVTFAVPADYMGANPIMNIASLSSPTNDPDLDNNVYALHTTVGAGADVSVVVDAPAIVPAGDHFAYTLSVTNNGPSDAQGVQVNSMLPAGLVFVGNAGDCTSAFPCAFPTIAVGVTKTVTTTVCVPQDYDGGIPMHISTNATSSTADAYLGNNSDAANVLLYADVLFRNGFESSICQ